MIIKKNLLNLYEMRQTRISKMVTRTMSFIKKKKKLRNETNARM